MKPKQLIYLIVAAAILGIAAYLMNRSNESGWSEAASSDENALLLPESAFDATKVASITLASGTESVTIYKNNGNWCVKERNDYPANMSTLKDFLITLTETRIARKLALSKEQFGELKLTPEAGAITLTLADADGKTLKSFIIGSEHMRDMGDEAPRNMMMFGGGGPMPDGRFILDGETPMLVAETLRSADTKPASWLDKEFFKCSDIQTAELQEDGKTLWALKHDDKSNDLKLQGTIPEGKEADSSKISSVKSAFSWIRFNDVAPLDSKPEDIGFAKTKTYIATDKDDFKYTIVFGETKDSKRYMKLASVEWFGATTRTPGKDEKPEDKEKLDKEFAEKVKKNQEKAANTNATIGKWIYEVGTYALSSIDKTFNDFLKDAPKPEPPKDDKTKDVEKK
ncbi:MAG: DUF4340 domain-containing protein [Victivallales bacterium]|nr:DUF4340 domain-containing protein [Victivallales bacterium]